MTQRQTHYPGYNVLDKSATPSWDDPTRAIMSERLSTPQTPRFFHPQAWQDVLALCRCVVPQADHNPMVPLAQMLDAMLIAGIRDGYRDVRMPPPDEAWRIGTTALDAEAKRASTMPFADLDHASQMALLNEMQQGKLSDAAWQKMPPALFFSSRVLHDICSAYYSHPHSWSEIGFGGPANPRGYVRLNLDRQDPWEASEVKPTPTDSPNQVSPPLATSLTSPLSKAKEHVVTLLRKETPRVR